MTEDKQMMWSDEVRERLRAWGDWARGNQLVRGAGNVLAAEIQRAAGESPGTDLSVPYDLTFNLEVTEKAIARMREGRDGKRLRRVLMSTYLGNRPIHEIATRMKTRENVVKMLLWRAESACGRHMIEVEKVLKLREKLVASVT